MEEDDVLVGLDLLGYLRSLLILAQYETHDCLTPELAGCGPGLSHRQPPMPIKQSISRTVSGWQAHALILSQAEPSLMHVLV